MAKIYLASPYSDHDAKVREARVEEASRVAALLMAQGHVVFSPITHGHSVAKYLEDKHLLCHDFWMAQCLPMLEDCDWMIILPLHGWRESRGVFREQQHAQWHGIPQFIWQENRTSVELLDSEEIEICSHNIFNKKGSINATE